MSDYYFSIAVGNRQRLCISPLRDDEFEDCGAPHLGYYLYAKDESADGMTILAQIGSEDAARDLYALLERLADSVPLAA